jgi:hypothetical protein
VSGVICQTFEELLAAPTCIPLLSRHECRQAFESRFTVERMARDYVEVYHQMLGQPFLGDSLHTAEASGLACAEQR